MVHRRNIHSASQIYFPNPKRPDLVTLPLRRTDIQLPPISSLDLTPQPPPSSSMPPLPYRPKPKAEEDTPRPAPSSSSRNTTKPWALPPPRTIRLYHCTIIDVLDGTILPSRDICLKDGKIQWIREHDKNEYMKFCARDTGEVRLDLKGKFVMPGLIDCHVHLASVPGESTLQGLRDMPPDVSLVRQAYVAEQMLARGFTSVRDCGGAGLAIKEAIEEGVVAGPRLFISGHGISQTGGHGDSRSSYDGEICGGHAKGLGRVADGVDECLKAAREELRGGADFIKIMSSGGVASPTDRLKTVQYTPEEIKSFTTVAKNADTYVSAHSYTPDSIRQAVLSGVRAIEHGNLLDAPTAALMKAHNVFLTPTLVTYATMASPEFSSFLPPESRAKNEEVIEGALKSLEIAEEHGVTMCFGTDLLGPLGKAQTQEFGLRGMVLDRKEVLKSATVNAACLLGWEGRIGMVREGYLADLIVLDDNPLEDLTVLEEEDGGGNKNLLAVIKEGRVWCSKLEGLKRDVRTPLESF